MPRFPSSVTHVGYADESWHNIGRYRAIALVSLEKDRHEFIDLRLRRILEEHSCDEVKWVELRTDFDLRITQRCFKEVHEYLRLGLMRCDVLIWDIEDSRHKIAGRDDRSNLARMYYHLLKNVLRVRWPDESKWAIYPDENSALDWDEIRGYLHTHSYSLASSKPIMSLREFGLHLRREFEIVELRGCDSVEEPLIQIADILAGLAVFSRNCFAKYQAWEESQSPQEKLFRDTGCDQLRLSTSERRRCQFLKDLRAFAGKQRMGVSLSSSGGLKTYRPEYPLNFWMYEPQSALDKAPTS